MPVFVNCSGFQTFRLPSTFTFLFYIRSSCRDWQQHSRIPLRNSRYQQNVNCYMLRIKRIIINGEGCCLCGTLHCFAQAPKGTWVVKSRFSLSVLLPGTNAPVNENPHPAAPGMNDHQKKNITRGITQRHQFTGFRPAEDNKNKLL